MPSFSKSKQHAPSAAHSDSVHARPHQALFAAANYKAMYIVLQVSRQTVLPLQQMGRVMTSPAPSSMLQAILLVLQQTLGTFPAPCVQCSTCSRACASLAGQLTLLSLATAGSCHFNPSQSSNSIPTFVHRCTSFPALPLPCPHCCTFSHLPWSLTKH